MTKHKPQYIIVDQHGDVVFNCETQSCFFKSAKAAWKAVKEELDEPVSEDGSHKTHTKRTDGESEKDYRLFFESHSQ